MGLRLFFLLVTFAIGTGGAFGNDAEDLARIHAEAMGGRKRIEALSALRASGEVISGDRRLRFTMIASRPNRIRQEMEGGGRTLVQGSDGVEPPWEFDTGTWPPRYRDMAEANARTFTADAEFDDPLVGGEKRGYELKAAGEAEVDGRKLLRVLVTRKQENFQLLLDPETYLIRLRVDRREGPNGKPVVAITRFDDFRPVSGVLLPHLVSVIVEGRVTQTMKVDHIDPNPTITRDTFSRPKPTGK